MNRIVRGIGIILAVLVGLVLVGVIAIFVTSNGKLNQQYNVQPEAVAVPTSAEGVARGEYLVSIFGCHDCHGDNLAGGPLIDDSAVAILPAPNLTSGQGGIGGTYTDADYVGAIRHGIRPDGTSLVIMPSPEYYYLNDEDLGAMIAYLKQVPPVDQPTPARTFGPIGRALVTFDQFPLAAALIPHDAPRPAAVANGPTAEHGEYLTHLCTGCHGPNLTGGQVPGEDPPINTPSITSAGSPGAWTQEEFITAMRTGVRPNGSQISEVMPWRTIAKATDDDLIAMYLFLHDLPPEGAFTE